MDYLVSNIAINIEYFSIFWGVHFFEDQYIQVTKIHCLSLPDMVSPHISVSKVYQLCGAQRTEHDTNCSLRLYLCTIMLYNKH